MIGEILWSPSEARQRGSALWHFAEHTQALHGCDPEDYAGLLAWSIDAPAAFHSALWDALDIIGDKGNVVFAPGETLRETRFFPEAELNYAENLLRDADNRQAIIAHLDDGSRREITRRGLYDLVSQIAQALRADGVGPGDRVGAIVTNDIEAIALYLATIAVGAIWCSCSPDFGPAGASDRLNQVAPKILVTVPGYGYGGKKFDILETISAVAAASSVQRIIVLGDVPATTEYCKPAVSLGAWIAPFATGEIDFHRGAFDAPAR